MLRIDSDVAVDQQTAGNGVVTSQTFDANTGLFTGTSASISRAPLAFLAFGALHATLES